jgi:hypothetical protein
LRDSPDNKTRRNLQKIAWLAYAKKSIHNG